MIPPAEYFRSVEVIWLLWLVSCLTLAGMTHRLLRRLQWPGVRGLVLREEGAAYSLVYVLTFPFYMMVICLVIESSLILVAKMGSIYAAYAGARARIVWQSAKPASEMDLRTTQAAVLAMAPFASGSKYHLGGGPLPPGNQAIEFEQAYHAYQPQAPGNVPYIQAKYNYAWKTIAPNLQVTSKSGNNPKWNDFITVSFSYDVPLHIPGIARILGKPSPFGSYYVYTISSKATLQNEGPKPEDVNSPTNSATTLGIDYQSNITN